MNIIPNDPQTAFGLGMLVGVYVILAVNWYKKFRLSSDRIKIAS